MRILINQLIILRGLPIVLMITNVCDYLKIIAAFLKFPISGILPNELIYCSWSIYIFFCNIKIKILFITFVFPSSSNYIKGFDSIVLQEFM